jgi:hypothetical protein
LALRASKHRASSIGFETESRLMRLKRFDAKLSAVQGLDDFRTSTAISTSFFYAKTPAFFHPNGGSQETLPALQNTDLSPRLGDSRQSEPKPTGQLALDAKSQSQDRDGRPFRPTGRTFSSSHRKLEQLIDQMRALSQQVLLNSVEEPARRKKENHPKCASPSRHSRLTST